MFMDPASTPRRIRTHLGESPSKGWGWDRPTIDESGARSMGTVHPVILEMLQREQMKQDYPGVDWNSLYHSYPDRPSFDDVSRLGPAEGYEESKIGGEYPIRTEREGDVPTYSLHPDTQLEYRPPNLNTEWWRDQPRSSLQAMLGEEDPFIEEYMDPEDRDQDSMAMGPTPRPGPYAPDTRFPDMRQEHFDEIGQFNLPAQLPTTLFTPGINARGPEGLPGGAQYPWEL